MKQGDQEVRRTEDPLTAEIIGACIEVHRLLGPGLLESVYEACLCRELELRKISFQRQVPVPIVYEGHTIGCGYRIDILARDSIVLELKAIEQLASVHKAQVLTYLKLTGHEVGLLINFNVTSLRQGPRRLTRKF